MNYPYNTVFMLQTSLLALLCLTLGACGSLSQFGNYNSDDEQLSQDAIHQDFALDAECFVGEQEYGYFPEIVEIDLWKRVRDGYQLKRQEHRRIDMELSWYAKHPTYMQRVTKRAERYMYHIVNEIEARDMPLEIALLPIVESAFDPFAYSHGRASGVWQIIPGTGKMLGLKQNWWYDGRRDIVASTDAALRYLKALNRQFDGDWMLALASYNSGAGNVRKAIRKNKKRGKPTDFWHLDLPKETKAYVPRLLALSRLIADPEKYNISLTPILNRPYFASVAVGSQIDLAQAAELASIDMDVLYHLNPAFNRWATDPRGPHTLLLPIEKAQQFEQQLAAIPQDQRVSWERYKIKNGDTLSTIAQQYNVSVSSLKSINNVRGSSIRAGKTLMVPVAAKSDKHYSHSVDERIAKRYASVSKKEDGHRVDYVVKPGDSFWSISRKYKVGTRELAKWNSMAPRDPIKPGQVLKIWTDEPKAPGTNAVIRKVSYKVRRGDSLARIAQKFRLSVNDIVKWNQINQNKYLQPGQKLTLFVDVTRT